MTYLARNTEFAGNANSVLAPSVQAIQTLQVMQTLYVTRKLCTNGQSLQLNHTSLQLQSLHTVTNSAGVTIFVAKARSANLASQNTYIRQLFGQL
jgi:hypothetical protein